jgi:hypothetical protein
VNKLLKSALFYAGLSCASIGLGTAASAAGFLYDCNVKSRTDGWISDKMAFVVNENGTIQVIDAVTLTFKVSPLAVQVSKNDDRVLSMHWKLRGAQIEDSIKIPFLDYRARINKKTLAISVNGKPRDFTNRWSGKGTCTIRTE